MLKHNSNCCFCKEAKEQQIAVNFILVTKKSQIVHSKEAKELLEKERYNQKDDRWIGHSICVGDSAGRIAKALQEKGIILSVEVAEVQRTQGILEIALLLAELLFSDVKIFFHCFFIIEEQRYINASTFSLKDADVFIKT